MRHLTTVSLVAFLLVQVLPISTWAQKQPDIFTLPTAQVMTSYEVNINQILRDDYKLKLSSNSQPQSLRWYVESGALPFGLRISPDGNIVGKPRRARAEAYIFKVGVQEPNVGSDPLVLTLQMRVEASALRLVSINTPKLVPLSENKSSEDQDGTNAFFNHRTLLTGESNGSLSPETANAATSRATASGAKPVTALPGPQFASSALTSNGATRSKAMSSEAAAVPSRMLSTAGRATPARAVNDPSCPGCLPSVPPDEKKDFIISARTGETSGKKKFGLHDNARIIVIEKNPFLYEYRVTLKDKPIVESAIAEFFGNWPLFADTLKPKDDKTGAAALPSCPQLDEPFNTLASLEKQLADADSSTDPNSLRNRYLAEKKSYDSVAKQADNAKKSLYDQNASCSTVCATATGIRSTLEQYQPDLDQLSDDINLFKSRADTFQRGLLDLDNQIRHSNPPLPNNCLAVIDGLRPLADGYMKTAEDLEAGLQKITSGQKAFNTIVKSINNVFASPTSFYQVYTRGEYSLPTDVEITVERKDLTKDDATFAKLVDAETINFGGGPRFAISGGVVYSPLETINFKRVPALINGQPATVVGRDESSNTRILPMLMLNARLFDGKGPINGVHMSLGVTAKPDDKGTNVEFLIGPSISFVEERLFLTFGGYAGRQKQLEGNLIPGQVLPKEFTDDIPTSNHLVWKPGIALTYKFK